MLPSTPSLGFLHCPALQSLSWNPPAEPKNLNNAVRPTNLHKQWIQKIQLKLFAILSTTHLHALIQLIRIPPRIRVQAIIRSCGTNFIQMMMMERRLIMHFHWKTGKICPKLQWKWIFVVRSSSKITLSWTEIYASTWSNSEGASYVSQWKSTTVPWRYGASREKDAPSPNE